MLYIIAVVRPLQNIIVNVITYLIETATITDNMVMKTSLPFKWQSMLVSIFLYARIKTANDNSKIGVKSAH